MTIIITDEKIESSFNQIFFMKRIFLASALLLSFLSFGQGFEIIEWYWKQDIKEETNRFSCNWIEPRHKKEKQECLNGLAERLKELDSLHQEEKKDFLTYRYNKGKLLGDIEYAKNHLPDNPQDSERVYRLVSSDLVKYMSHIEKCVNNYRWSMELYMIIIEKDPKTVFNVTIRRVEESDFR